MQPWPWCCLAFTLWHTFESHWHRSHRVKTCENDWRHGASRVAQEVVRVLLSAKAQISPDTGDGPQELQDAIDGCHVEALQQKSSAAFCFLLSMLCWVNAPPHLHGRVHRAQEQNRTEQSRTEQSRTICIHTDIYTNKHIIYIVYVCVYIYIYIKLQWPWGWIWAEQSMRMSTEICLQILDVEWAKQLNCTTASSSISTPWRPEACDSSFQVVRLLTQAGADLFCGEEGRSWLSTWNHMSKGQKPK